MDAAGEEGGIRYEDVVEQLLSGPARSGAHRLHIPPPPRPPRPPAPPPTQWTNPPPPSTRSRRRRMISSPGCLELLLIQTTPDSDGPFVGIVGAPRLEVLGILDLELHGLEIGGTTIREIRLMVRLLKCFPHLETLHIKSIPCASHDIDIENCLELWSNQDSCECLESHLKMVRFQGYRVPRGKSSYISLPGKSDSCAFPEPNHIWYPGKRWGVVSSCLELPPSSSYTFENSTGGSAHWQHRHSWPSRFPTSGPKLPPALSDFDGYFGNPEVFLSRGWIFFSMERIEICDFCWQRGSASTHFLNLLLILNLSILFNFQNVDWNRSGAFYR